MKTVDGVITRFRRHFSDCDATTALDLFQTAYKRLLAKAQIRVADTTFSAFVEGTREYAWAEADLQCWGVTYYESADSYWALDITSEDALIDACPDWAADTTEGAPKSCYIAARTDGSSNKTGKLVIGFDPVPDTSTSGGYPKAVAHVSQNAVITGTTEIPYALLDELYFVYFMCELWCQENGWLLPTKTSGNCGSEWRRLRVAEESVQIGHLHTLTTRDGGARVLPPSGAFSTPLV